MFRWTFITLSIVSLLCASSFGLHVHEVMVNNGSRGDNYFDPKNMASFGLLKDVRKDKDMMHKFESVALTPTHSGADGETADLVKRYFWGQSNGIIMEIGAVDGVLLSQSKPFEDSLGWHRVLVEGSPLNAKDLAANSPNAFAFTCAICDTARYVHYKSAGPVGGIVEFMNPKFLHDFHPKLLTLEPSQWHTVPDVQRVACFPLGKLLAATNIYHINAFIVDVEGGELGMLHSVNWDAVLFDVIIVETDTPYRPLGYDLQVTAYLAVRGYHPHYRFGRNTWYKHVAFQPFVKPA